jgi:HPr kinase/phosphorylase
MSAADATAPLHVHGTALALGTAAALIRGASGSGKSDLALRCLAVPFGTLIGEAARLVADDQVIITPTGMDLVVSAPDTIRGKLEVRGVGIIEVAAVASARLALVVDLVTPEQVERMPEEHHVWLAGVQVPCLTLAPFEASAPVKLLLRLQRAEMQNP